MSAGLEAVKRKLRSHAAGALNAGKLEAFKQANIIAGLARSFVPEAEGKLRRSIRVADATTVDMSERMNVTETEFRGYVVLAGDDSTIVTNERGAKFQNAKLQEGGTQNMPANPFLNPARRMRAKAANAALKRAMTKAWKAGGK